MIRHLVIADAAALLAEEDPAVADTLLAIACGMYPLCVQYDERTTSLIFRRSNGAGEVRGDRAARLAAASDELLALPGIQWWIAESAGTPPPAVVPQTAAALAVGTPVAPGSGSAMTVAWPLVLRCGGTAGAAEAHARVLPDLLRWTRCERDAAWSTLRRWLAAEARRRSHTPAPTTARTLRTARLLDTVGEDALAAGHTREAALALCRQAADHSGKP